MTSRVKSTSIERNIPQFATHSQRLVLFTRLREIISSRRSARLRAECSSESSIIHASQARAVQASFTCSALVSQMARIKRKRAQEDSEAEAEESKCERLAKQPRRSPPTQHELSSTQHELSSTQPELSPTQHELSEKNLREFNEEEMNRAADNARSSSIKPTPSRCSIAASSDITQDTARSQRSSDITAYYRYTHLSMAEVYIHTDPPDDIQHAIDVIVKVELSEKRRAGLRVISKEFHDDCKKAVKASIGEDDFIEPFLTALRAMNHSSLCLRAKADWREELKPTIRQAGLDWDFMKDQQQAIDDASASSSKHQQPIVGSTYSSPRTSMTDASDSTPADKLPESRTMPPPPIISVPKKEGDRSSIKTPRPAISMGTEEATLISALSSKSLNNSRAKQFVKELQNMIPREEGEPEKPMLIFKPALRASDLVFPFAVLEGKAYSTGSQIFGAENQAAVSGACGLKIQLCLDEVVNRATTSFDIALTPSNTMRPLFFSICTQGPIHELWAHYTLLENDVRTFNQTLLKICHGTLRESVDEFIVAVDNVCRWGTGKFLESVVERLRKVARRARA